MSRGWPRVWPRPVAALLAFLALCGFLDRFEGDLAFGPGTGTVIGFDGHAGEDPVTTGEDRPDRQLASEEHHALLHADEPVAARHAHR